MWLQGVPREPPPEPSAQPSSILVEDPGSAAQDDRSSSDSEGDSVEDNPELDPERVIPPEEEQRVKVFIDKAKTLASKRGKPEPVFTRFTHKTPYCLPAGDDRFNPEKKNRRFACDVCGMVVGLSRKSLGTGARFWGDFLGSYCDHTWKSLPADLHQEAYNLGLIDASWKCWTYCNGDITGSKPEKRLERTAKHQAKMKRPRGS